MQFDNRCTDLSTPEAAQPVITSSEKTTCVPHMCQGTSCFATNVNVTSWRHTSDVRAYLVIRLRTGDKGPVFVASERSILARRLSQVSSVWLSLGRSRIHFFLQNEAHVVPQRLLKVLNFLKYANKYLCKQYLVSCTRYLVSSSDCLDTLVSVVRVSEASLRSRWWWEQCTTSTISSASPVNNAVTGNSSINPFAA